MTPLLAQTNLQLYRQMMQAGASETDLSLANRAYLLAARMTGGVLRGSGKPFACHLVGTASAVVESGLLGPAIPAALLHASLQDRVPFPGGRKGDQRREYLRRHFGTDVEALVHAYHLLEDASFLAFSDARLRAERMVVLLRLADEVDDLADDGPCMHGSPGDNDTIPGSAAARLAHARGRVPDFLRIARVIDAPSIERHCARWLARSADHDWPTSLRTGAYSSFDAAFPTDDVSIG